MRNIGNDTPVIREGLNDNEINDINTILVPTKLDIAKSLRKLAKEDAMLVINAIYKKTPSSFAEIQTEVAVPAQELSRILYELKNSGLIVKKDDQYYLTKYCLILLSAIDRIKSEILDVSNEVDGVFGPLIKNRIIGAISDCRHPKHS